MPQLWNQGISCGHAAVDFRRYEFELLPPRGPRNKPMFDKPVDEVTPYRIETPFLEIDWCWGYIGYVNMLRYRVQSENEVHRNKPRWLTWRDARDTDVVLDETKMTSLIRLALERVQRSVSQAGAGTLSAYTS